MNDDAFLNARCSKCGETKPLEAFKPCKRKLNGRGSWCRSCERADGIEWRAHNVERFRATNKRWCDAFASEYHKKWRKENRHKVAGYEKKWRLANPEKVRAHSKNSDKRRLANVTYRLARAMSNAIRKSLQCGKNGNSWEQVLGYTRDDLACHLEGQFLPGMSWGNRAAWHIDHITPISVFNYSSYSEPAFKQCWALENLRPLWAAQNMKKKNKITEVDIHV